MGRTVQIVAILALTACTPTPVQPPRPAFDTTIGSTARPYLGCWRILTTQPTRRGINTHEVRVRLDSVVFTMRDSVVALDGLGYLGFGDDRNGAPIRWMVVQGADSLIVTAGMLSGPNWHFSGRGDSLSGRAGQHWDFADANDVAPAVALRVACSGAAARAA